MPVNRATAHTIVSTQCLDYWDLRYKNLLPVAVALGNCHQS